MGENLAREPSGHWTYHLVAWYHCRCDSDLSRFCLQERSRHVEVPVARAGDPRRGLVAAAALAADPIPLDSDGLPAWSVKQWTDFPVRLELADRAALDRLLAQVPVADFHREQVRPEFSAGKITRLILETRVTDAEFAALVGCRLLRPTRLRDVERENREASERLWAAMAAGKAGDLRTDPLNYVPTNDQIGTMLQGWPPTTPTRHATSAGASRSRDAPSTVW